MNRDEIKGKIEEIKGDVKQKIGKATDDPRTQVEGMAEEKKGQVRQGVGDLEKDVSRSVNKDPDE
jgi:uncharacterized protein YjbJ (UPF0337 family)